MSREAVLDDEHGPPLATAHGDVHRRGPDGLPVRDIWASGGVDATLMRCVVPLCRVTQPEAAMTTTIAANLTATSSERGGNAGRLTREGQSDVKPSTATKCSP